MLAPHLLQYLHLAKTNKVDLHACKGVIVWQAPRYSVTFQVLNVLCTIFNFCKLKMRMFTTLQRQLALFDTQKCIDMQHAPSKNSANNQSSASLQLKRTCTIEIKHIKD